jgi:hypothetical protein
MSNLYVVLTHRGVTLTPLISGLAALGVLEGARVDMLGDYCPMRFTELFASNRSNW